LRVLEILVEIYSSDKASGDKALTTAENTNEKIFMNPSQTSSTATSIVEFLIPVSYSTTLPPLTLYNEIPISTRLPRIITSFSTTTAKTESVTEPSLHEETSTYPDVFSNYDTSTQIWFSGI